MLSVLGTKAVSATLSAVLTSLCGLLPWKIGKYVDPENQRHKFVISLSLCCGAGILMATCLTHMAPEFIENLEKAYPTFPMPLGLTFMCIGFFLIYLIEETVHSCLQKKGKDKDGVSNILPEGITGPATDCNNKAQLQNGVEEDIPSVEIQQPQKQSTSLREMLTVLALSFHSVFEGMAIGLENSQAHVWLMFSAIAVHKSVIAFCVGLELFTKPANTTVKVSVIYVLTFASMTPLGICVGMGITSVLEPDSQSWLAVVGFSQALAGGTLLYVTVFEILDRERARPDVNGLAQLAAIVLGFAIILAVGVYVEKMGIE